MDSGEIKQISINEPIKIGVFVKHPRLISKEDNILYFESHQINKETMALKIIVDQLPKYIAIDPYGTRSDENFVDNLKKL
jgi:ABC-2 type transport system permease protein